MQELFKALSAFQKEVVNPTKDATNPHFKSNYVKIDGIIEAVKEPLSKHGLSYTQIFRVSEGVTYLVTRLNHVSGDFIESELPIQPDKSNIQGFGAAVTYLRRYSLESICGIAGEDDDDGEKAVKSNANVANKGQVKEAQKATAAQVNYLNNLLEQKYGDAIPAPIAAAVKGIAKTSASKKIEELEKELGIEKKNKK
jgi:hypothetical protein